jgi:hypothetical protein
VTQPAADRTFSQKASPKLAPLADDAEPAMALGV